MVQSGMVQSGSVPMIYVNPTIGENTATGSQVAPLRTLSSALHRATTGTIIQLAKGTYNTDSGEIFPLVVPAGVTLVGDEAAQGRGVVLHGGGLYDSPAYGQHLITLRLETAAQLRGVTVTNPSPGGIGVWVESAAPTIAHCTITACNQTGLVATGVAKPLIQETRITANGDRGILLTHHAKGDIRRNRLHNNGLGIAVQDDAAPLLLENQIEQNRWGIYLAQRATPVLRGNILQQNTEGGIVIINNALPDLGRMGDPGNNTIRHNQGIADVNNATGRKLVAVGNQLDMARLRGDLALTEDLPLPPTTIPAPVPDSTPSPNPLPSPSPTPQFRDTTAHWAEQFIAALVGRNILRGFPDGTFKPESAMTRAQFAATIATAFPIADKRQPTEYGDVPAGFWAAQAIRKADSTGFMSGFPDGSFRPNLNITRVQALVAIVQGLGLRAGGPSDLGNYRDRAQIPSYAADAIATATQRRLVVNYPRLDYLNPLRDITRAEVAALIYQALVTLNRAPGLPSQFIVHPVAITTNFTDVQGHWAAAFIAGLAGQRMIGGFADGSFRPDANMTRVQYCGLLANAFNPAPRRAATSFRDVPANFWGAAIVQQAYRGGFISGFTDGTFRPNDAISRVQIWVSIAAGLGLPAAATKLLERYLDRDRIPTYALPAVASATANRLVINQPMPQWLNPTLPATRAEVTATVYQALVRAGRLPAIASPFIITPLEHE